VAIRQNFCGHPAEFLWPSGGIFMAVRQNLPYHTQFLFFSGVLSIGNSAGETHFLNS
jgi:hypothetical protein